MSRVAKVSETERYVEVEHLCPACGSAQLWRKEYRGISPGSGKPRPWPGAGHSYVCASCAVLVMARGGIAVQGLNRDAWAHVLAAIERVQLRSNGDA